MGGTYTVRVGDRGRVMIPAELRSAGRFEPGTTLVAIDAPSGLVLMTRDQLKRRVRADLAGLDLVSELLDERRQTSRSEDS